MFSFFGIPSIHLKYCFNPDSIFVNLIFANFFFKYKFLESKPKESPGVPFLTFILYFSKFFILRIFLIKFLTVIFFLKLN